MYNDPTKRLDRPDAAGFPRKQPMLGPEDLMPIYRRFAGRKVKALGFGAMRLLGFRHLLVRMDTINLCDLRCKMCYYSADYKRKKEEIDLPTFRRIAEQVFPKTRFLYLSCSTEPLTNKHFAEFVRAAGEYRVPFTSFCTNGQALTREVVQACIEARQSEIIFSIDGAVGPTYEAIRRGGKWDRLLEKLELLAAMKRQASSRYPQIRINFICMLSNIRELPAMVHFAADHEARCLNVRHLLSYTDEENSCQEETRYLEIFNSVAQEARQEAALRGIKLLLPDEVPERSPAALGKTCHTGDSGVEANPYCMLPWYQVVFSWKGECRVCPVHTLGNLREQTFAEIHEGPQMRSIRRKMLWRRPDSCSWDCHQDAYGIPDQAPELIGIASSFET
jgi:MoaA/NifB/PqqE/SkfB family radical SAM enzyme